MSQKCPDGHSQVYICSKGPPKICPKCERAKKLADERKEHDLAEQKRQDEELKAHLAAIDALDAQIEQKRRLQQAEELRRQRKLAIEHKTQELDNMDISSPMACYSVSPSIPTPFTTPSLSSEINSSLPASPPPISPQQNIEPPSLTPLRASFPQSIPSGTPSSISTPTTSGNEVQGSLLSKVWNTMSAFSKPIHKTASNSSPATGRPFKKLPESSAKQDWEHRKNLYGTRNDTIDAIMEMTGLEEVKAQILKFLSKIETSTRQNVSLKRERFNVVFLGNPGTGK